MFLYAFLLTFVTLSSSESCPRDAMVKALDGVIVINEFEL